MKKFFMRFLDEVKGFCWVIGFRNDAKHLAIGFALTILLLLACGMGEAISRLNH